MHRGGSWIHEKAFGESTVQKIMRWHRGERVQFDESLSLGAQVCSRASGDENSGSGSSRGQKREEARKVATVAIDQSREQQGGYSWSIEREKGSPLCNTDGHLSSQKMRSKNLSLKNTKAGSYSEVTFWKTIQALMLYPLNKVRLRHKWRPQKKWMSLQDHLAVQDKRPTQHLLAAPKLLQHPKTECPDTWIRHPRHKWPMSWSNIEDPVLPLERNLHGHPLAGLLWERQFEEVLLGPGREKVPDWERPFVHRKQGSFLSVNVDDFLMAGRKQNMFPHVEEIGETGRSWRTNIFSWPYAFGLFSTWMQTERNYLLKNVDNFFRITKVCWSNWKIVRVGETSRKTRRAVMLKSAMKIYVSWRIDSTCTRFFALCLDDHLCKKGELESVGVVRSMLSDCFFFFLRVVFGTNWSTWHSLVRKQTCMSSHKMDKSLRQTLRSFDSLHPSPTTLARVTNTSRLFLRIMKLCSLVIVKGRSLTMRHVSRTHRVALDWLFVRVNLDPKSKSNMLTPRTNLPTHWLNVILSVMSGTIFVRSFNIMNFSMFSCSHFLSIKKPNTMSKWAEERRTGEELVVAKSKSISLASRKLSVKQSPTLNSGASYKPVNPRLGRNSVFTSTGRPVCGIKNQLTRMKLDHLNLQISDNLHIEKVFTKVRQRLNRSGWRQWMQAKLRSRERRIEKITSGFFKTNSSLCQEVCDLEPFIS